MIKEYLEIGQVGATHGVKGEFRLNPWCDSPEFVKKIKMFYRDDKGSEPVKVVSCRPHGNICIIKLENVNTVEEAAKLKNKVFYMKRADVNLPKGKWFVSELMGCQVIDADDENVTYGTVKDIENGVANDIWYIDTLNGEVLIPAIKEVIINCDVENNKVYIRPLRGLFTDED